MKTKHLVAVYIILILLTVGYLFMVENVAAGEFSLNKGGRDLKVSFYDFTVVLVFLVAAALTVIATKAFDKKNSDRLFFVASAFFLFALKSALLIVYNFVQGNYGYIGISMQTLELLILLLLFFALFRK